MIILQHGRTSVFAHEKFHPAKRIFAFARGTFWKKTKRTDPKSVGSMRWKACYSW